MTPPRTGSGLRRAALRSIAWLALLAAAPLTAAGENPQVTIRLAPDPVALGELATLEIHVAATGFESPKIEPRFELENLEIAGGPYQAQNFSWVNGRTSSSFQLIWRLRPLAAGAARVKAILLTVEGQELAQDDQEIAVVDEAPPGRAGGAAAPDPAPADPFDQLFDTSRSAHRRAAAQRPKVLVRAEVEPANPVVGQQIAYRLVLYTQTDISAFNPQGLPDFRGFWAREVTLPDKARPEWVQLEGERYGRVVMLQRALFPLQAGKLTLAPIDVEVVLRVAEAGFFGPFGRNVPQRTRTQPLVVDVKPLPEAPPGFTGVVGDLVARAQLDPATTEAGQAATFVLTVESRGNLQGLPAPELSLPAGLRADAPRPATKERVAGGALVSTQSWSYVLVPEQPGEYELPAVELPYFDAKAGRFATAASEPLRLRVWPASTAFAAAEPAASPTPATTPATATTAPTPALPPTALWLGGGLAVAALIGVGFALGRRAGRPDAGPRQRFLVALAAAPHEPARATGDAFEAAWRGFLADRHGLPADVPVADLVARLRAGGVTAEGAAAVAALFEEIDYLRHAPELSDVGHLREEILGRSKRLARDLR